jgi:rare lipoprotein A
MRSGGRIFVAVLALAPLAACGMVDGRNDSHPRPGMSMAAPGGGVHAESHDALPQVPVAHASSTSDETMLLGASYAIDGKTYTPEPVTSLDEVGYAAVLGEAADGRRTATGEAYIPGAISAAHRTLPLPSYVEVTSLDTGRTILVRVNDRGPLLGNRVIALSPAAARQIGLPVNDGTAAVRVRKVNPTEQDKTLLRNAGQAAQRIETPLGLRMVLIKRLPPQPAPLAAPVRTLAFAAPAPAPAPAPTPAVAKAKAPAPALAKAKTPAPVKAPTPTSAPAPASAPAVSAVQAVPVPAATPAPVAQPAESGPIRKVVPVQHSGRARLAEPQPERRLTPTPAAASAPAQAATRAGGYVVQVAALSTKAKADSLARAVGGFVTPAGRLFRVRTGPYDSDEAGRAALTRIRAKGYADARLMANDAR